MNSEKVKMLRVPPEESKENKSAMGGCNCKRQKLKISNNFELLPPKILVDHLRPSLKDISVEKNKIIFPCRCRAKSTSNEENCNSTGAVRDDKKRSCSTSTISEYVQDNNVHKNIIINGPVQIIYPQPRVMKKEQSKNQEKHSKNTKSVSTSTKSLTKDVASNEKTVKSVFTSTRVTENAASSTDITKKIYVDRHLKSTNVRSSTQHNFDVRDDVKSISRGTYKMQENNFSTSTIDHSSTTVVAQYTTKPSGNQTDSREIHEFKTEQTCIQEKDNTTVQMKKMTYDLGTTEALSLTSQTEKTECESDDGKSLLFPMMSSGIDLFECLGVSSVSSSGDMSQVSVFSEPEFEPKFTPIQPNSHTASHVLISKKPASFREPKIKRRSVINDTCNTNNLSYVGDIYNEEYLNDIFAYILVLEKDTVLKHGFLRTYDANYKCRSGIINWILKTQAYLRFSEGEHYLAIYMLDRVLSQIYVPINMYQLLMMSTLWIATKVIGSNNLQGSTLISLSDGSYMIQQLLKMELKVLKMMKFHIPTIEPSICIHYFLKLLHLEKNDLAKFSAFYVLDCFSLMAEFSSTCPTILAAAAINFIINTYNGENRQDIHFALKHIFFSDDLKRIKTTESQIYMQLTNMLDKDYPFKEPYRKYGGQV